MVRKSKTLRDYGGNRKVINEYQFNSSKSNDQVSFTCENCGQRKKSLKRSLVKRLEEKRKIHCVDCKYAK